MIVTSKHLAESENYSGQGNDGIRIFYAFTHLIMGSNGSNVSFFIPTANLDDIKQYLINKQLIQ
jgi:hypothetical protein